MKMLFLSMIGALAIATTARAQEPKSHEHEHAQPPAVAEQKADEKAEHKEMCACCTDKAAMQEKMAGMKKDMMGRMGDMKDKK